MRPGAAGEAEEGRSSPGPMDALTTTAVNAGKIRSAMNDGIEAVRRENAMKWVAEGAAKRATHTSGEGRQTCAKTPRARTSAKAMKRCAETPTDDLRQ